MTQQRAGERRGARRGGACPARRQYRHDVNGSATRDLFQAFFVVISLLRYFISSFFIPNKKRNPVPRSSNLLERLAHASFARYQSKV
jgi:hypothetical protein